MQRLAQVAFIVLAGAFALSANAAAPRSPLVTASAARVTPVAMGCGVGRTRDAMGHCRQRFNLFRHDRGFRAYKDRHCTPMTTPNGPVNRCKI